MILLVQNYPTLTRLDAYNGNGQDCRAAASMGRHCQLGVCVDQTDIKILSLLQKDASSSVAEIAERVNLSVTPCWRRIQKLKEDGIIARNAILLNPKALGFNLTVFVSIKTHQHNAKWTQTLMGSVMALPNVVEFHRMAGDTDYLLKVIVKDMAAYDRFYRCLIDMVDLMDVTANFSMEVVKSTTELPLNIV